MLKFFCVLFTFSLIQILGFVSVSANFVTDPYFSPATAKVTEYGAILTHGMTYEDLWKNTTNTPPTDGTINTYSFKADGTQIVTKGNTYYILENNTYIWKSENLKSHFSACSNFPENGIDALTINPKDNKEYAIKNNLVFVINSQKQCELNGMDIASNWATKKSPSGEYPFTNSLKIDQFQWIDENTQAIFVKEKLYLIGANTNSIENKYKCSLPLPTSAWQFCNPDTLLNRWSSFVKHPPVDKVQIFAQDYKKGFQIFGNGKYLWTLGITNENTEINSKFAWETFRSGFDGFGLRESFIFFDKNKYYLIYDSMDAGTSWKPALAVATHPKGPWKKMGVIKFNGQTRNWESETEAALTVFKDVKSGGFYGYYLGAQSTWESLNGLLRVPAPKNGEYYKQGLAFTTDIENMVFNKLSLEGDFETGVKAKGNNILSSSSTEPSLIPSASTNSYWNYPFSGSSSGSLINKNNKYYLSFASQAVGRTRFGTGIAVAENFLGPYKQETKALIPAEMQTENSGITYIPELDMYFLVTNAIYADNSTLWKQYFHNCVNQTGSGVGLVMFWSNDLLNWNYTNNYKMVANAKGESAKTIPTSKDYLCFGEANFDPKTVPNHDGQVGMGYPIYIPAENKIYVMFDGNSFASKTLEQGMLNHYFRNLFLLSIDLPKKGDLNNDSKIDLIDTNVFISAFFDKTSVFKRTDLNGNEKIDLPDIIQILKLK